MNCISFDDQGLFTVAINTLSLDATPEYEIDAARLQRRNHVRERHVDDGDVEDVHEDTDDERHRHDPLVVPGSR